MTLNEAIQANIAQLEAQAAEIAAKAQADVGAIQAQIDIAKQHMTGLLPYLEHEVAAAKDALVAFFAKLGA
jgi:hypothetical protein